MPTLKLQKRAEIALDFIDALKDMLHTRAKILIEKRNATNPRMLPMWDQQNGLALSKLKALLTDPTFFDKEMTSLRSLSFTAFGTYDGRFLAARTEPIVLEDQSYGNLWDMGVYTVFVPVTIASRGLESTINDGTQVHFVPNRDPLTRYRHPHHVVAWNRGLSDDQLASYTHPTQMPSSTCWGGYATIAVNTVMSAYYTDFFRAIHSYLTRYDPGSPLTNLGNITFKKSLGVNPNYVPPKPSKRRSSRRR